VLHIPPRLTKSAYQILLSCNAAPRQWHLEGRFGSRTHVVEEGKINGIPILFNEEHMKKMIESSNNHTELEELINTDDVSIVEKVFVQNHRTRQLVPTVDARIHPELEPEGYVIPSIKPICADAKYSHGAHSFTYAEMFGGIGGFGVGLEALGGKCVFYSEIDEQCRETYKLNFPETETICIHGDIYDVQDSELPRNLDLLVAGFPCQPFSNLGDQPGFQCEKGRGQLFLQIVRVLEISRPKAFLLENVPGLLSMKDTLDVILKALRGAGYTVYAEVCSAAGLTATARKRLFFVGIRNDEGTNTTVESSQKSSNYQFPYMPDLKLSAQDILDYETLDKSEADILKLSPETFDQLRNSRWKPHHLAWPNKKCDTLTSHYGNAVGRGDSQLVPSASPNPPRRFSVRECARIMTFGNSFKFVSARHDQGEMAYRKQCYRMLGNAVCPPLIAALAGSVLDAIDVQMRDDVGVKTKAKGCWTEIGRDVAIKLACQSLRPEPSLPLPAGCLISLQTK
jgi:DNA (cytosine-5)-methyltransferase 1